MKNKYTCKTCLNEFFGYGNRIFCSKKCLGYENSKRIKFSLNQLTKEEKLERIKKSFEKKVIKNYGCWDWKGNIQKTGYILIRYEGKKQLAHRVSWIIYNGYIPSGLFVLHKCDNRKCTNPEHLFLGSLKENAQDRDKKIRGLQGERHHKSKLTEKDVIEIKKRLYIGVTQKRLANDFNVSVGTIWFINKNITWKHLKNRDKDEYK